MSILRLDLNENPLGPSPAAIKAARRQLAFCHRYPDEQEKTFKKHLANHLGLSFENITLGNGSESLLSLIAAIYLKAENSAILSRYSFLGLQKILENSPGKLKIAANSLHEKTIEPLVLAIDSTTRLLFVVNPDNPTGHYFNAQQIETLLQRIPSTVLVIIDEAYAEYVTADNYASTIHWVNRYPNLIVSRSFSKFYGLAGLRLGYTVSHASIARCLQHHRLPFALNSITLSAAKAALQDKQHIQATQINHQSSLLRLKKGLQELAILSYPTQTNFVCVDLKKQSQPIYQQLLQHGIRVRPLGDHGMPNHLRISVGRPEQAAYFLPIFQQILN